METQNQLSNGIGTATSVVLIEAGDWKQRMLCSVVLLSCCSLDSRRAREISHAVDENWSTTTGWNSELSTLDDLCSQLTKQLGKMPLSPYLTTVTQLHVTKIT